ncbi:hypothetical protein NOV72_02624 [Caballeronia novacaledonica]|uniref:Tox-REase-5 domain-containing protein n=1 Tax=Caballeronia novacaledonica TaxID=1544861 RepID=A0A2U3I5M0_9BURK|nr:Tox-REase-5 domain-containing protein [Caballeronia novacaledonica]SPB15398.1 hypothetical protein NOV72_02624 [Caballeronia novacaledonica]
MAALAIPVLEAAAEGIAALWAALSSGGAVSTVAGGAATGAILSLPGDTANDKDKAQTDTQVKVRTRERECKCPPDRGQMAPVNHAMSDLSARYQQYVTGFPRGIEWKFGGKDFDGFVSAQCLMQEAKANFEFFFYDNGRPKFFFLKGVGPKTADKKQEPSASESLVKQATAQSAIVTESPPSKLRWYFMQDKLFNWATTEFAKDGLNLSTELMPMLVKENIE